MVLCQDNNRAAGANGGAVAAGIGAGLIAAVGGLGVAVGSGVGVAGVGVAELQKLKEEVEYPKVDKVYSSPMLRCKQTANLLYPYKDIQLVDNLREIDFGDFTGRYCGMEQGTTVKFDAVIKKGDTVGKTGDLPCESGQEPHFHFEVLKDGKNVDPIDAIR